MRTTYIYGVWDLGIQKFVYAGKSNMPPIRFKVHMKYSSNEDLRELVAEKGAESFGLIILEKTGFFTPRGWVKREKFWVKKFRKEGHPLCNKNDGGQGPTEHTEETLAKMSVALSGDNNPRGFLGKHHTKETLVRQSKIMSGKNNPMYGKHHTKKTKAKQSKSSKGNKSAVKSYPAFYNIRTGEFVPAGQNLKKMCNEHNLNSTIMFNIKTGLTKRSHNGWELAGVDKSIELKPC